MRRRFFVGFGLALSALAARALPPSLAERPMTLGFRPDEFRARFNTEASEARVEARITSTALRPLSAVADNWQYEFHRSLALIAPVNKSDGTIASFALVWTADGQKESVARLVVVMELIIRCVDQALSPKTTARTAMDLFTNAFKTPGQPIERIFNGIRYAGLVPEKGMFMMAINPVVK